MPDEIDPYDAEQLNGTGLFYDVYATSPASIALTLLPEHRMVTVNDGFATLFGYDREEAIGKTAEELGLLVNNPQARKILDRLERGEATRWEHLQIQTKDGQVRDVIGSYIPIERAGHRFACNKMVDVTRMNELEEEVLKASERERQQLARNLHDDLGQRLSGLSHYSSAVVKKLRKKAPEEAELVDEIQQELQKALEETRRLARGMMPVELTEHGLPGALKSLARSADAAFGININLEMPEELTFHDPTVGEHLYRIVQEAVNNAERHGNAEHIIIRLSKNSDALTLEVIDNGSGIPENISTSTGGLGLHTMRYRARIIKGSLEVRPGEEGGTIVRCSVPINAVKA